LRKAIDTLTREDLFQNYQTFGDPEGSKTLKALHLAVPTWIFEEDFRPILLTWGFIAVIAALLGFCVM